MLKNFFKNLLGVLRKLNTRSKNIILGIICVVIALSIFISLIEFPSLKTSDEVYDELTNYAYDIIDSKNLYVPLTDNLYSYSIEVSSNGNMEIALYSTNCEKLDIVLTSNFELISMERKSATAIVILAAILLILIFSYYLYWIFKFIVFVIKKIYSFFKNLNKTDKE